jgi:GNAT superfamily N-acetyltransferase
MKTRLLQNIVLALLLCTCFLAYLLLLAIKFPGETPADVSSQAKLLEPRTVATRRQRKSLPQHKDDVCMKDYQRVMSKKTKGLTEEDFLRSRAWVGNEQRLAKFVTKLEKSSRDADAGPVNVIVAGGSITLGHGVHPYNGKYSNRLERWLLMMYPPRQQRAATYAEKNATKQERKMHRVYNRGSHGADICAMAKRIEQNFALLGVEPDLVILEFGVNDYQGQDHKIYLDHKTDVFFQGFQEKAMCAEAVIHKLIHKYPDVAIMFLEFQTGILNRKTAQLLHMGVAQHYQIPMISYAEAMMPGYYNLLEKLKDYDYSAPIGDRVAPFPHGCARCIEERITDQFRPSGCKSVCDFVQKSGLPVNNCRNPPAGREKCSLPILAHDYVHPSFVGHGVATDLLTHAIATTKKKLCSGQPLSKHILPPASINLLGSDTELSTLTDWVMVKDTMEVFGEQDPLESTNYSTGFLNYGDRFAERRGWICTEEKGGESIEFNVTLPKGCYVLYIASLKSYEGMGDYTVLIRDEETGNSYQMDLNGMWEPRISVPADVAIKPQGQRNTVCSGNCKVSVLTHAKKPERNGNKVKIMTLSARTCRVDEF